MKVRTLLVIPALFLIGTTIGLSQMGSWKLNETKSKIPTAAIKANTVVYETVGDNVKCTVDGTRNGQPYHSEWTGKFDGKDYPVTGDAAADMRAYTKIDDHTLSMSGKKDGKVVQSGRIVVSADGKTRTVHMTTTDSSGKKVSGTSFYDKQ